VCVCLYLFVRNYISRTACAIFTKFLCILPIAVALSSGGVTKCEGEGTISGLFFTIDYSLYSIAFGTHTKTAEPIVFVTVAGLRLSAMKYGLLLPARLIGQYCFARWRLSTLSSSVTLPAGRAVRRPTLHGQGRRRDSKSEGDKT